MTGYDAFRLFLIAYKYGKLAGAPFIPALLLTRTIRFAEANENTDKRTINGRSHNRCDLYDAIAMMSSKYVKCNFEFNAYRPTMFLCIVIRHWGNILQKLDGTDGLSYVRYRTSPGSFQSFAPTKLKHCGCNLQHVPLKPLLELRVSRSIPNIIIIIVNSETSAFENVVRQKYNENWNEAHAHG